jgi:ABC-type cobalamin/Fe3+-siderophores transport system ATPase subunit
MFLESQELDDDRSWVRSFDAYLDKLRVEFEGHVSEIPPPRPGVTLVLGRNGTGKSNFLQSIAALSKGAKHAFPTLSLIYRMPDVNSEASFRQFVETKLNDVQFLEDKKKYEWKTEAPYETEFFSLPVISAVRVALGINGLQRQNTEFLVAGNSPSDEHLLHLFGFSQDEIERHLERRKGVLVGGPAYMDAWSQYFTDFFLAVIKSRNPNNSDLIIEGSPYWPNPTTSHESSSLDLRVVHVIRHLFEHGLVEFAMGRTRLESDDGASSIHKLPSAHIRFVVDTQNKKMLREFLEWLKNEEKDFFEGTVLDDPVRELSFRSQFPHNAIMTTSQPHEIATKWFVLKEDRQLEEDTDWSKFRGLIQTATLSGFASAEQIENRLKSNLRWSFSLPEDHDLADEDIQTACVGTLDVDTVRDHLRRASQLLRDMEMGISELKLVSEWEFATPPAWANRISRDYPRDKPEFPVLVFVDNHTSRNLQIRLASDGQLVAINLSLLLTDERSEKNHGIAATVLLADELDRHFHPTASSKVLAVVHRHAMNNGISTLISTHNLPTLNAEMLKQCDRLVATRDALGRFELQMNPRHAPEDLSSFLGVDLLRARSLARLHLLVEGIHDELLIEEVLSHSDIRVHDIEIVHMGGIGNLLAAWESRVRPLTSPILVVYDNRNPEFEATWNQCRKLNDGAARDRLLSLRGPRTSPELKGLLRLAERVSDPEQLDDSHTQVQRLGFFGLTKLDILHYIPFGGFKEGSGLGGTDLESVTSWEELAGPSDIESSKKSEWLYRKLKQTSVVQKVLDHLKSSGKSDSWIHHPDFIELRMRILELL